MIIGGLGQAAQQSMIHAQDGRLINFWANECPKRTAELHGNVTFATEAAGIIIFVCQCRNTDRSRYETYRRRGPKAVIICPF
jgi:hypothetical protein